MIVNKYVHYSKLDVRCRVSRNSETSHNFLQLFQVKFTNAYEKCDSKSIDRRDKMESAIIAL